MENGTALEVLYDLAQILIKFLGRAVVQRQLFVVGLTLLVAAGASRLLNAWLNRRFSEQPLSPVEEEMPLEEVGETKGDSGPSSSSSWPGRGSNLVLTLIHQLGYPILSLGLGYLAVGLFAVQNWPGGLIEEFTTLLWIFLAYRFSVALLSVTIPGQTARYYHNRLLRPMFIVILVVMVLSMLTQLGTLARAPLFFQDDERPLTMGALVIAAVGFYFWLIVTQALQEGLQAGVADRNQDDSGSFQASLIIGRYILIVVGLFVVFRTLQLDTTTIAAITGGLSIGLGFALQDVIKNFLGGIILLFEGTIRPGDWVEVEGIEGEVERLQIRTTTIRRLDNVRIIVPNQEWLTSEVTTYSYGSRRSQIRVPVGVSYESDLQQVQRLLIETARQHPEILQDPAPSTALLNFGDSTLDMVTLGWVADPKIRVRVTGELRAMIADTFNEHGVEVPPPQQEVYVHIDSKI
jgi:potassium efflux system protein